MEAAVPICRKSRCQVYRQGAVPESAFYTLLSIPKKQLKVAKMQQVTFSVQIDFLKALGNHLTTLEEIEIVEDVPRLDVPNDVLPRQAPIYET